MNLKDLYIDFFVSKGHVFIPSAPVVPENDPSVLFNTVGMQPLVGNVDISKQRASTPLERGREGLTSAISANVQSVSSQEKNKLSNYAWAVASKLSFTARSVKNV